jgi:pyridoxamine 5'-phosphate oxidase
MSNITDIRKDYSLAGLHENDLNTDPMQQFERWFEEARQAQVLEANGMILSTIDANMRPKARVVLLKGLDERGFVFFTNYNSQKGNDLSHHAVAALTFWWVELERQVRIEGVVEKVTDQESDLYFSSRPKGSQLGAWVSEQSKVIAGREVLDKRQEEFESLFDEKVPRPAHWGGYRLMPDAIEFWQGRPSRLHDRLKYQKKGEVWTIERLAP